MSPDIALEKQIEVYRRMSGEERLLIGLRLHELSCEVARDGIRAQFPEATPAQVEENLRQRLKLAYEL
jgi:hypothetical protein